MESVTYKNEACELCDDFMDVGYMAENFEACNIEDSILEIKRSRPERGMSIFVSFPSFDEEFGTEIFKLDMLLDDLEIDVACYLIFNTKTDDLVLLSSKLKKFTILIDHEDDFGNMYGTKIVSGALKNKLTKSLFLISKDGSVFYVDTPNDLNKEIDLQRLRVELNKAHETYTGKGCH